MRGFDKTNVNNYETVKEQKYVSIGTANTVNINNPSISNPITAYPKLQRFSDISYFLLLNNNQHRNRYLQILSDIVSFAETDENCDIEYSIRVLEYVYSISNLNENAKLSAIDLFCLISSAIVFISNDATDKLLSVFQNSNIANYSDRMIEAISRIIANQNALCKDLYTENLQDDNDSIFSETLHIGVISAILRIGTLMDVENNRVNNHVREEVMRSFSAISSEIDMIQLKVNKFVHNKSLLSLETTSDTVLQYKIWMVWSDCLKTEIIHANTYLHDFGLYFPILRSTLNKGKNANFDIEEIRFEIDDNGSIWNIISQSVYTNRFDYVRELIQNAIDATLYDSYADETKILNNESPRFWALSEKSSVWIIYSSKNKELVIADNGIGMDKQDLNKFLFKVAATGYSKKEHRRAFQFPSIAKFGVGFVSCLVNAKRIKINTKIGRNLTSLDVSLASNSNLAIIEPSNNMPTDYHGTWITLMLKEQDLTFYELSKYIKKTFIYPSISLRCLDFDALKHVAKSMSFDISEDLQISNVQIIEGIIDAYSMKLSIDRAERDAKIQPISYLHDIIDDFIEQAKEIESEAKKISNKKERNLSNRRDFAKIERHFNKLENKINLLLQTSTWLPKLNLNINIYTPSKFFESFIFFIDQLQEYTKVLDDIKGKIEKLPYETLDSDFFEIPINPVQIRNAYDKKYCIIYLNDDFNIEKVDYCDEINSLKYKFGIVYINHIFNDPDIGIECAFKIGLIFADGKLCNKLYKFTRSIEINSLTRDDIIKDNSNGKVFIVGSSNDVYSPYDEIDEILENDSEYSDDYYYNETTDERVPVFEDCFDIIAIDGNDIVYGHDIELSTINNFNNEKAYKLNSFFDDYVIFYADVYKLIPEDVRIFLQRDAKNYKSLFCQDGIVFSENLDSLCPIGLTQLKCNFTSISRLALNVSRHSISQTPTALDPWFEKCGKFIQESIIQCIESFCVTTSLKCDMSELIQDDIDVNSYFAIKARQQFYALCKKQKAR